MKKTVSLLLVVAILVSCVVSFTVFAVPAYAHENEEVIENTTESVETADEAEVVENVGVPETTEATEATEAVEVTEATEAAEVEEVADVAEAAEETEVDLLPAIPEELDGFEIIDFEIKDIEIPAGINILGAYQMVELCKEYDADAKICVVRNENDSHYFVVEWADGSVDYILVFLMDIDGEDLLFSFGEEFAIKF